MRSRRIPVVVIALLAVATGVSSEGVSTADDALSSALAVEQTFADVIARSESGVVSIARRDAAADSEPRLPFRPFGRRPGPASVELDDLPQFFGTGVVIAQNAATQRRYVLTNDHVLRGGRPDAPMGDSKLSANVVFDVYLSNHRRVRAKVIASDPRSDLAVLELELAGSGIAPDDVPALKLGDASEIRKGQLVLAMGNPYAIARDGSASASWGIVSNISRRPMAEDEDADDAGMETIHQFGTLLHVDTRLDLGMSGGALLNLKGELIGLTTSLAALRGYEKSVGYAIPFDESMRRIIDELLKGYEVEYGFLGIQPGDASLSDLRAQRAPVEYVSAARTMMVAWDSPADQAGLHRDDLILAINEEPVHSASDLMREIGLLGPDAVAKLHIWRRAERREMTLPTKLGKWPVHDDSRIIATATRHIPWRGLTIDYPTARRRLQTSDVMERYHRAVLITAVEEGSAGDLAQLRVGDYVTHVEDIPVETPAQFRAATDGLSKAATLVRLDGSRIEVPPPVATTP